MPDVSRDGLTWTFHIKPGIKYAPPLQDTEVTAQDFVRALLREADPIGSGAFAYSFYYSVIQGFDAVVAGRADAISGLIVLDPHTLEIQLEKPAADLGYRLSLPAAAPIPPDPFHPSAILGVAQAHPGDYGHYLVGTGPYMLEGSENLDFSKPGLLQPGVAGYQPSRSITLVRNPSWRRATDDLRPALVDRIEIQIATTPVVGNVQDLSPLVESGRLDLMLDAPPPPDQLGMYRSDPTLSGRVHSDPVNQMTYVSVNLSVPPFDDLHVRRAVSLVLDKRALLRLANSTGFPSRIATHAATDSLEGGLLAIADPYPMDLARALGEMRKSRYDRNGDGRCDVRACRDVRFEELIAAGQVGVGSLWTPVVRRSLALIGIDLAPTSQSFQTDAPSERIPIEFGLGATWQSDYPDASTFFEGVFSRGGIRSLTSFNTLNYNFSLLGASSDQLRKWGYSVTKVPSVDDRIRACEAVVGIAGTRCWAQLDQYLMENVVPIVPILTSETVRFVSARVRGYSIDQFTGLPALDRISLESGST
jgi:ABC-type oligopeptide transport system substrate-binding subunit